MGNEPVQAASLIVPLWGAITVGISIIGAALLGMRAIEQRLALFVTKDELASHHNGCMLHRTTAAAARAEKEKEVDRRLELLEKAYIDTTRELSKIVGLLEEHMAREKRARI